MGYGRDALYAAARDGRPLSSGTALAGCISRSRTCRPCSGLSPAQLERNRCPRLDERREESELAALTPHTDTHGTAQLEDGEPTQPSGVLSAGPTPQAPDSGIEPSRWAQVLREPDQPAHGHVEFRFIDKRTRPARVRRRWDPVDDVRLSAHRIHQLENAGMHVFVGLALRNAAGRSGDDACLPTTLLWADLDLKGTPGVGNVLQLSPAGLHALKLRQFHGLMEQRHALPPVAVVDSGHGLQVMYRRQPGRATQTRELNLGLAARLAPLGADAAVVNLERVFRPPGSRNLKNPQRPLVVSLWHLDVGARVSEAVEGQLLRRTIGRAAAARGSKHAPAGGRRQVLPVMRHPRPYALAALEGRRRPLRAARRVPAMPSSTRPRSGSHGW